MKARMKGNLVELYEKYLPGEIEAQENGEETVSFLKSIEGNDINLIFTTGDAFEEKDNNIWLPDGLWDEI